MEERLITRQEMRDARLTEQETLDMVNLNREFLNRRNSLYPLLKPLTMDEFRHREANPDL